MHSAAQNPAFWLAISFVVFFALVWKVARRLFLQVMQNYRISIVTKLKMLEEEQKISESMLEKSSKILKESCQNTIVLNAHKLAKEIAEDSTHTVENLKNSYNLEEVIASTKAVLQKKAEISIKEQTTRLVTKYLNKNQEEFNQIAQEKVFATLSVKKA